MSPAGLGDKRGRSTGIRSVVSPSTSTFILTGPFERPDYRTLIRDSQADRAQRLPRDMPQSLGQVP